MSNLDSDNAETKEWVDALYALKHHAGISRVNYILQQVLQETESLGAQIASINSAYNNTISLAEQAVYPGDPALEAKITGLIRWNATVMVIKAGENTNLGGHIGSFASSAELYEVGFNHFWRAANADFAGDLILFQGHISPGIYARSFLEGRLSQEQITNFRREVAGNGLSSYPHPWLMPSYWQFPTVSMGLGALQAIYSARFIKYLQARELLAISNRKVWCFCGDGEMDEPESLGAIGVASREKLDNLIFVINCNLQRLDGPVRGNGKIIQELEGYFNGANWEVIKVIWGAGWDEILTKDRSGKLMARLEKLLDGEFQNFNANDGAYIREHLFGQDPELLQMVAHLSDTQLRNLSHGGHDLTKIFAAYHRAMHATKPVVILAKTIKGYGLGKAGEGLNTAHNTKKMTINELQDFAQRFEIPATQSQIENLEFIQDSPQSAQMQYLHARRQELNGFLPARRQHADEALKVPELASFESHLSGSGERELSSTMAFVRILTTLCKDKHIGARIVPIVPDEARTFGMEGLFRQLGIYAPEGQLYTPVDKAQVMFYKEAKNGQILEEGINEAGAFSSWLAAATSYSVNNKVMIPFYIYYSMFGFQRIGDLAWAAGDSRARGFLLGATAGRTTLNGEGLQHEDGHSHVMATLIPNCLNYDPTFNYELAVIVQEGLRRMVKEQEDIFYYITLMNENYLHPAMPAGSEAGILRGMYKFRETKSDLHVHLLGSGTIFNEVIAAADILEAEFNITATLWSATSFSLLARDGNACVRTNRFQATASEPYVTSLLSETIAPVIAATDYVRAYADAIREFVPSSYAVLGTDGFGRSDLREKLREFFEVNRYYIVITALHELVQSKQVPAKLLAQAIKQFGLDVTKPNPMTV